MKEINFVQGNKTQNLLQLTIPLLVAFIFNIAYNVVDSLWVGNLLGQEAMAALTASAPYILLFTSIYMGAGNGVAILLSQYIGAGDEENVQKTIVVSFITSFSVCILITALSLVFIDNILGLLNVPKEIYLMAKQYLSIYLWGLVFVFFYFYLSAILRSYGNAVLQMTAIIFCTLLNAILDPIFIHFMGFMGAALSTIFSQGLGALILMIYCFHKKFMKLQLKSFDYKFILSILNKQVPSIVQQSLPAISTSFITSIVNGFSISAIAGFGIAGKLEMILLFPAMALQMSMTTIVGQCYGAKQMGCVTDYLKTAVKYAGIFITLLAVLVVIFSSNLTNLFVRSEDVSIIVKTYFLIIGAGYIFNVMTNCFLGSINGLGNANAGMFLMMFYYILVRMPLAKILSLTSLQIKGIWIAVLISHIAAFLTSFIYFYILHNSKKNTIMSEEVEEEQVSFNTSSQ